MGVKPDMKLAGKLAAQVVTYRYRQESQDPKGTRILHDKGVSEV
jgi:hypothetical protein